MATERGWAIAGPHGLYLGWWTTRAEAIIGHLIGYRGVGNVGASRTLTAKERKEWNERKKRGDRVVKVTIRF